MPTSEGYGRCGRGAGGTKAGGEAYMTVTDTGVCGGGGQCVGGRRFPLFSSLLSRHLSLPLSWFIGKSV